MFLPWDGSLSLLIVGVGLFSWFEKKHVWFGICVLILWSPSCLQLLAGVDLARSSLVIKSGFVLLSLLILLWPLLILKPKGFVLCGLPFLILLPMEWIHLLWYGLPMNAGTWLAVFRTNPAEAKEFLMTWNLLLCIYALLVFLYLYAVFKIPKGWNFPGKWKLSLSAVLLLLLGVLWVRDLRFAMLWNPQAGVLQHLQIATWTFENKFDKIIPYSSLRQGYHAWAMYQKQLEVLSQPILPLQAVRNRQEPLTLVVVLGESARAQSFGLWWGDRDTILNTPQLKSHGALVWHDFTTQAALTSLSLPMILTQNHVRNFNQESSNVSWISAFREVGFQTTWISNQDFYGSELVKYVNQLDRIEDLNQRMEASRSYDEAVLPILQKTIQRPFDQQLIVIHLMGSHFRYSYRYPEGWGQDLSRLPRDFDYSDIHSSHRSDLLGQYENSIRYTDHLLGQMIRLLMQQKHATALVYVSDHGENLFEQEGVFGHGTTLATPFEIQIPFVFWASEHFKRAHPELVQTFDANRCSLASTRHFFPSILDLAGIRWPEFNASESVFSRAFQSDSNREVLLPDFSVVRYGQRIPNFCP
jgi:glucan phosphoethanolaminetransferase (alkaline phosphatase superfamily)